jgi:hypothetical protein
VAGAAAVAASGLGAMILAATELDRMVAQLQALTPANWARPTVCELWDVRAMAAGAGHPAGRVHHSCFGPDGDLMVYEVWESQQAFEDYGKVLMPTARSTAIPAGGFTVRP